MKPNIQITFFVANSHHQSLHMQ